MKESPDLLRAARDEIDNAVFAAILSLSTSKTRIEWDVSVIREATDAIKSVMERHGMKVCHPWPDNNKIICHRAEGRCSYCPMCK